MQYGFFDDKNREYVITNPDTPAPWVNYLGSPAYGALISGNAGGYSFIKSGGDGRVLRYHFNGHLDEPGRYIYIRDDDDGDFWSASWQPVGKELEKCKYECRHGTSYSKFTADYSKILTETLYYIPLDKDYEVWNIKIKNIDNKPRRISIFGYAEFTCDPNYQQDQHNMQYTQFTTQTYFFENKIVQTINENYKKEAKQRFFGLKGGKIASYNGDREAFLGRYHSYANPVSVVNGKCDNTLNYNTNPCGALHTDFVLRSGEEKIITFLLGGHDDAAANEIMAAYDDPATVQKEYENVSEYWHSKLDKFKVTTPDPVFNTMVNTWNAYQCFINFIWSRTASFTYCGQQFGFGFRDAVQDLQSILHIDPHMIETKMRHMLAGQVDTGGGLPIVKFDNNPGHEDVPNDTILDSDVNDTSKTPYRADDCLWLFPSIYKYISETGNIAFLDEVIPYANKDKDPVYGHLKRAIDFNMKRQGANKMPAGLHADWNDGLRMGARGESVFVAMQLYYAMVIIRIFAEHKNDSEYIKYLDEIQPALYESIQKNCWETDQFIRGITEDGLVVGSKNDTEGSLWLNPQSWGVISGLATDEQIKLSLDKVYNQLSTKYGVRIFAPSYKNNDYGCNTMIVINPSTKENGGVFSHTQGWIILAEALAGNGDRAFEYFKNAAPASMNDKAEIRKVEPYAHCQSVESVESPFEGRGHVHWLTGATVTNMVGCVEGILGFRPDLNGMKICPAIPKAWDEIIIEREFRGKKLFVKIENKNKLKAPSHIILNGEKINGDYILIEKFKDSNDIVVVM